MFTVSLYHICPHLTLHLHVDEFPMLLSKTDSSTSHWGPFALSYLQCCSNSSPLSYITSLFRTVPISIPTRHSFFHSLTHTHTHTLHLLPIVFPQLAAATFILEQTSLKNCLYSLSPSLLSLFLKSTLTRLFVLPTPSNPLSSGKVAECVLIYQFSGCILI